MRAVDLIQLKRDGGELNTGQIQWLIREYTEGRIPDYQMSAWAMAVYFQGMSARETADLTLAMAHSGDQMDLSGIQGVKVDKHSTGGVGDTTTLVLAPLVAAAGVPVAKMSGRGLGHTGGTIDKLESISGFKVELEKEQFVRQVNQCGVAVMSQTGNITPADKKLYGLRDVTGTVSSIPLIASSIMSKKMASGADAIVLDVKTGSGAFMKTLESSVALAEAMVAIGNQVGRETVAVISSMEQPLGLAVGNALEVREAIDTLRGQGPADLEELCLSLGAYMVVLGGKAADYASAKDRLAGLLRGGQGLAKLREMIEAQGGDPGVVDDPDRLPSAKRIIPVAAAGSGYVQAIEAERVGLAAMKVGAGRAAADSAIDLAVGVMLRRKPGDSVSAGDTLAELHVNDAPEEAVESALQELLSAYRIGAAAPPPARQIYATVTAEGVQERP